MLVIKLLNLWLNGRIAAAIGSDISCKSFKRSISQPYLVHLNRNSSSLITTLISEVNLTVVAINLFLKLLTALILSLGILVGLSLINFQVSVDKKKFVIIKKDLHRSRSFLCVGDFLN